MKGDRSLQSSHLLLQLRDLRTDRFLRCFQPDTRFADARRTTVEKGNAPDFDMPKDAYFDAGDIAAETTLTGLNSAPTTAAGMPDDRARGWSSALFPSKPTTPESASANMQNHNRTTVSWPYGCNANAEHGTDRRFVFAEIIRAEAVMRLIAMLREISDNLARLLVRRWRGDQSTDRWQDKANCVRRHRSVRKWLSARWFYLRRMAP